MQIGDLMLTTPVLGALRKAYPEARLTLLADSRWRLLGETGFSERVSRKGESILLSCFTAFVKLRWCAGVPVDAKAYLMAFNQ